MVIQHNLDAMNASEAVRKNVSGLKKKTEKLSTGYKINRAADNASGLSVSEKMRSQIRGLSQATCNSNDAISLIQTAEGGLQESEDIVQRMRELAVQAANGTYTDEDRQQIQYEVDALKIEVNRIAESTEFNTMKLLDGSNGGVSHFDTYGARYGIVAGESAGSLAGTILTSSIAGVKVAVTPEVSGKGGENAVWSEDGKTLTLNLVKDGIYSQSHLNELIRNADVSKCGSNGHADITFTVPDGILAYKGDLSNTGNTVAGSRSTFVGDLRALIDPFDPTGGMEDSADKITFTANTYGSPADIGYAHTIGICTDVGAGDESVEVKDCEVYTGAKDLVMHLATGVTYTEKDLENLLLKAGFDYTVDLTDQIDPDGDSDDHVRFLVKSEVELKERVSSGTSRSLSRDQQMQDGVQYYIRRIDGVRTITGITEFLSGYHYMEDDGSGHYTDVPTGAVADPLKTYAYTAGDNITWIPVAPEDFDPQLEYYKDVPYKYMVPPDSPAYVRTSDSSPVAGKTYYYRDPGDFEEVHLGTSGFGNGIYYYTRNSDGVYKNVYGASYDPNETYYIQTRVGRDEYYEADVSGGFLRDLTYYETAPPYSIWMEPGSSGRGQGGGVGRDMFVSGGGGLVFQIGANGVEDQKLYVTIDDMSADALGISDVSVKTTELAQKAIEQTDSAIKAISTQRAKLGAVQNRLEHTLNSLNVSNENLSAAESQIRDTDMASEMVDFTKYNILQQASQSMLAQANQQPQSVLQLLG